MTVEQLIFELEGLEDVAGEQAEVLIYLQRSYPLATTINNVIEKDGKIIIAINDATKYGTRDAWQ